MPPIPALDLANLPDLWRRIALLHDSGDPPFRPDDAAVAVWPFHNGGHDGRGGLRSLVYLKEPPHRGAAQKRHIAGQEDHSALPSGQSRLGLLKRMGGSELRILNHKVTIRSCAYR